MSDTASELPPAPLAPEPQVAPGPLAPPAALAPQRRLRLWPAVVILVLEWLGMTVPALVASNPQVQFMGLFLGPFVAAILLALWWLFGSGLAWGDRLFGLAACVGMGAAAAFASQDTMPMFALMMYALPVVTTAWVAWLLVSFGLRWPVRRAGLLVVFLLVWTWFALLRFEGVDGDFKAAFSWRWQPTAEETFLAGRKAAASAVPAGEVLTLAPGDWPAFRGPNRDGRLSGVRIATDWAQRPPRELWRRRVGPGWSSFAVVGPRLYTQEQWDAEEAVVCYNTATGEQLWAHRDPARFTEIVAGPGPRATPTFHDSKIYAFGAAGRLNCLDAATGTGLWSRDVAADSGAKVPQWGFASSPLVAQGLVSVFAGGPGGKSVQAYKAPSGDPAWAAGEGELSYCSPQLARLGGVEQLLIATDAGLCAFEPNGGKVLWQYSWPTTNVARIVQPAVLDSGDVVVGTGMGVGTKRLHLTPSGTGWSPEEVWTTKAIKPYFNDLVIHQDHLYGFDGNFFTCVNLKDGKSRWRERGYGSGQVLLLADQALLLVLSEQGEVALLEASPEAHRELGRFEAIKGKTWNHPVLAHGKLFVRNGEEMACYELRSAE